ncbi:MAG TPA: EAL domain-containing protein, partial [Rhodocyclaceae bacterium]|nr:EAL domain-containing protein [Rhodocyclaceae bacterium]
KIDKSFVDKLEQEDSARAVISAIVVMGHALALNVLAEGVETAAQRAFLVSIGCDELQGYQFSKPLPAEAVA